MILLAFNYFNNYLDQIDANRLWNQYNNISSITESKQNNISTQSAVLIEANPDLWDALPPGASDLLEKVESISK